MLKYILNIALGFLLVSCSANFVKQSSGTDVKAPGIPPRNISGVSNGVTQSITVEEGDSLLGIQNGVYYYKDGLFSGNIISRYASSMVKEKSPYFNGLKEGISYSWFENGQVESERNYSKGEKDGTHYGWYESGAKRFEYNFKNGFADGESTEWYRTGGVAKKTIYNNGVEDRVQAWRDNGKLYANYVIKDGVIYGLNNSNLCYSLKNERGEYVSKK